MLGVKTLFSLEGINTEYIVNKERKYLNKNFI